MLALRRATVTAVDGDWLQVSLETVPAEPVRAWSDPALHPGAVVGDELVVNVQARALELGSGGYDVVVANLTRGLEGAGRTADHVMKLNYTPLQHAVAPVDGEPASDPATAPPVAVLALHGQLEPLAWALGAARPGARLGFVQSAGGALPGALSQTIARLRHRGLLSAHLTAGPAYGGEEEAITVAGAITALAARTDAIVVGPGPGIVGSASTLGHGGMAAMGSAHAALALGHRTLVVARMSEADPRERHRGLSHHTRTVLRLLLKPVTVALPEGHAPPPDLERHDWRVAPADLAAYPGTLRTMGREDPLFFASALAAGGVLAGL